MISEATHARIDDLELTVSELTRLYSWLESEEDAELFILCYTHEEIGFDFEESLQAVAQAQAAEAGVFETEEEYLAHCF